jgi:site-specific DNA-methyltransferase (adenine-specific)
MGARIIVGDFRNYLDMPEWQDCFVVSDPPYNQGYHYGQYGDSLHDDEYAGLLRTAFWGRKSVVISYPEETINVLAPILGEVREVVSWVYPSNTAKQSRLVSWWGCRPDFKRVGQPYKNPTDKRIAARIAAGKMARLYDWWDINQVKNVSKARNPHPCPIPYELARRIVLTTTEPGDMVVDPFCGSGTVLQAATDAGRRAVGFDIDREYADYSAGSVLATPEDDEMATAEELAPVCGACSGCYDRDPLDCGQPEAIGVS